MKHFSLLVVSLFAILLPSLASASTSAILVPTATGTYSEWTPKTAVAHYTTVDETPCNGTTDYVATSTTTKRDSFSISLATIPDNSLISAIAVVPCASRATTGTGSSALNVFYRYNGANSSDMGAYAPSGTTPSALATSTWSSLSLTKTSTSTLEIGMVYTSGTKGARLSRIATQLTYTTPGAVPSATTSAATSVSTSSALLNGSANPNATSTTAWFRIATSTPGTCNDTFGTRVPLSLSTNLGAGTSSVAYSTTTTGLSQNTTYYYCAIAQNGNGKGYGGVQSFSTSYGPPTVISSNITTNQTWTSGIYVISNSITINSGVTLTIDPGVIVKFSNTVSSVITVNGNINANGNSGSMVYFTSYKDDAAGGDTNGDGTTTSPASGNWGTIKVNSGGTASFKYTVARYGGYSSSYGDFYNNGGALSIATSTIASAGLAGVYHLFGTTTVASTTIIDNVGAYGVYSAGGSGMVDISTSYFSGNAFAGSFELNNLVFKSHLNSIVTATSQVNGFQILGTPAASQTLEAGVPYIVVGPLTVSPSTTLTIGAGVVVKFFGATSKITVNGSLSATGTLSSPIYFTSYKDDAIGGDTNGDGGVITPNSGDWVNIEVASGGTATFSQVIARYSGNFAAHGSFYNSGGLLSIAYSTTTANGWSGVNHQYGTTTVASSTIADNIGTYAVYSSGGSGLFDISNTTFSGNASPGLIDPANLVFRSRGNTVVNGASQVGGYYINGTLNVDQSWDAGVPYVINGPLTVSSGVTLKIGPGAIFKMLATYVNITVNGTLNADSSAGGKIYFTSAKDDSVGGDTNGDGATAPAAGNWDGIIVNTGGITTLNYAVARFGGNAGASSKQIWNNGGVVNIYQTELATSTSYGVYNSSGTTTIIAADIHSNNYGACITGGTLSMGGSNIHDNSTYGFCNTTFSSVNAKDNYWGTSSGPYNASSNPSGGGNTVSDLVNFSPWMSQMHYLYSVGNGITTAVDGGSIDWNWYNGVPTAYSDAWYGAVNTWNKGGVIAIATDTKFTTLDLEVEDINSTSTSDWFVAVYDSTFSPHRLRFNKYFMDQYILTRQQNAATHELGHGLGLYHSFPGNIMNSYSTTQTATGTQDKSDYDYCWIVAFCVP